MTDQQHTTCPNCGHHHTADPIEQQVERWRALLQQEGLPIGLDDLVSSRTAAKLLDRSAGTVANWRSLGGGPTATPVGHGQPGWQWPMALFIARSGRI